MSRFAIQNRPKLFIFKVQFPVQDMLNMDRKDFYGLVFVMYCLFG